MMARKLQRYVGYSVTPYLSGNVGADLTKIEQYRNANETRKFQSTVVKLLTGIKNSLTGGSSGSTVTSKPMSELGKNLLLAGLGAGAVAGLGAGAVAGLGAGAVAGLGAALASAIKEHLPKIYSEPSTGSGPTLKFSKDKSPIQPFYNKPDATFGENLGTGFGKANRELVVSHFETQG